MKSRGFKTIILNVLKKGGYFTLNQVVKETGLSRRDVRDVLTELAINDYLRRIAKTDDPRPDMRTGPTCRNVKYRVHKPKDLAKKIAPKFKGESTSFDKMWFVIRKMRNFTRRDLLRLTSDMQGDPIISMETVRWFTKMLSRAGIIGQTSRGEWVLYKDTGPRRPYVGDQVRSKETKR
jgi:hypothetical protein